MKLIHYFLILRQAYVDQTLQRMARQVYSTSTKYGYSKAQGNYTIHARKFYCGYSGTKF